MFTIDKDFYSLSDFLSWAKDNRYIYDITFSNSMANRIVQNGFTEPLTSRICNKTEITGSHENLREGLAFHGINSRVRAVLYVLDKIYGNLNPHSLKVYSPEAITALALLLRSIYPKFIGSEYCLNKKSIDDLFPIQHQDLMMLNYPTNVFDCVVTNEVLEHVPCIDSSLKEIARVLKVGGWHVGTHPFRLHDDDGDIRAIIKDGKIINLKEPHFHGNPAAPDLGSLVFEIPGWNILNRALNSGFSKAFMTFVSLEKHAIISENAGIFVLCAQK
jgi:SAM-dependent methyltransferase